MEQMMLDITSDYLTVIPFLIGTSSFVLGLFVDKFSGLSAAMKKVYRVLILSLLIPSTIMILYGISLINDSSTYGPHMVLFILMLAPIGTMLYLISRSTFA
jgi:FtsH-binding integral membrane protein